MARSPLFLLIAVAAGLASPALAYCPSFPDGPQSANFANGTALALCQQAEIAADAERHRQQVMMQTRLQILERQQLVLQQQLLTPPPAVPVP